MERCQACWSEHQCAHFSILLERTPRNRVAGQVILRGRTSISQGIMGVGVRGSRGAVVWAGLFPHHRAWPKACCTSVSTGRPYHLRALKWLCPAMSRLTCQPDGENRPLTLVLRRGEVASYHDVEGQAQVFALAPLSLRTGSPRSPPLLYPEPIFHSNFNVYNTLFYWILFDLKINLS